MTDDALPPPGWRTLREIDTSAGRPKGSAFRVFRALAQGWSEGRDFRLIRRIEDAPAFERVAPRLYAGSLTAILVAPAPAQAIEARLNATG